MSDDRKTRREVVRDGATVAAGIAMGAKAADALAKEAETKPAVKPPGVCKKKIRSYNQNMEYRRLGKTGLMVSAVSLGGHWKQIPYKPGTEDFKKNRREVISACIDHGINLVDACTSRENIAYSEALRGRRDKMYFCYSWYEHEMRFDDWQSVDKLIQSFEEGLKAAKHDHVDIWRITCYEGGGKHTPTHEEIMIKALEKAKKSGKARFVGISSHDRKWLKTMIETYPQLEMILTPYTAGSKEREKGSLFEALKKQNVGMLGIKPFASGSVFRSRGAINPATQKIDDDRARLTLRHVLAANDALTAAIPGMISVDQVKNAAQAVTERRKFDKAETRRFERAVQEMWANLPEDYQWLRDWEWV
ncbi:MAG: aldo/keto reductase [Planctomycetota bacterium]|nr:MAG: aldo/keto reductase [Planctomycetota bacterium]